MEEKRMKISELKIGQSAVEVEGQVTDISDVKSFNKFGRSISVATATLADESGNIKLSLWNQDIEKVKTGDKVKITNGFVKDFKGELQLTAGKFGKIEVIGKGEKKVEKKPKLEKEEKKKMDESEDDFDLGEEESDSEGEDEDF